MDRIDCPHNRAHSQAKIQQITEKRPLQVDDIELTLREFSGTNGAQQISRSGASL